MSISSLSLTIDVVDDDPDVLGSLRFLLETEGFLVRTFASGPAFLSAMFGSIQRTDPNIAASFQESCRDSPARTVFAPVNPGLAAEPRRRPDCLVIDYRMEAMNGIDLIRFLRERRIATPVVLITGYPDENIPRKAASMGVRHVVLKPHVEDSLVMHVRAAMAEGQAETRG